MRVCTDPAQDARPAVDPPGLRANPARWGADFGCQGAPLVVRTLQDELKPPEIRHRPSYGLLFVSGYAAEAHTDDVPLAGVGFSQAWRDYSDDNLLSTSFSGAGGQHRSHTTSSCSGENEECPSPPFGRGSRDSLNGLIQAPGGLEGLEKRGSWGVYSLPAVPRRRW
ncbi:hypothetical protein OH76DRAFT_1410411 [Lentinus brumalis]|uniref:Uncharacterized protein n=1 Tax=Lentinus brumalis TaxID=2498619 RepID=A0A371CSD8_9APHY|nr:hypothetical protein OH76DRAFT_1410411 [Polyporus brumalis]